MRVRVLLFAGLRERLGAKTVDLDVAEGARVADAIAQLERTHPQLRGQRFACAIDETYADTGAPLQDGATLALIPPVSGG